MSNSPRQWAVGMTTAPRRISTLQRTLHSLANAGWKSPRIFAEPETSLPPDFAHLPISRRDSVLGAFPNWYLGLSELYLRRPHADAYLICQDDAMFTRGAKDYLERILWPAPQVGVVSLYCPSHEHRNDTSGFHAIDPGWGAWGAVAYIFSNPSVRDLLSDPVVVNHRHHGPAEGARNIDSVVGSWCRRRELPYFVHVPSLVQHIGETSTLWRRGGLGGRRSAIQFDPLQPPGLALRSSLSHGDRTSFSPPPSPRSQGFS